MPDNQWPCVARNVHRESESSVSLRKLPDVHRLPLQPRSAGDAASHARSICWPASLTHVFALLLLSSASNACAELIEATDDFRFSYAPSAIHRSGSNGHVRYNNLFSAELLTERWRIFGADRTTIGAAIFNNSFGQPCQYVFAGPEWDLMPLQSGRVFANVTAGALHGYTGEHQDKIPFNRFGTAPAAIPSIGWRYSQAAIVLSLLGNSGVLISFSWSLDR